MSCDHRVQRETSEFPVPAGVTDPRERRDHEVLPEVMDLTGQRDFGDPLDPPDPLVMPQRASSTAEEGTLTISRRSKRCVITFSCGMALRRKYAGIHDRHI